MKFFKTVVDFLFLVKKKKKKKHQLAHLFHTRPITTRIVAHLPLPELAIIVWEFHRGCCQEKRLYRKKPCKCVRSTHFKICFRCQNFIYFCLNEMWRKWDFHQYTRYGVFIFQLTKQCRFDVYFLNLEKHNKYKNEIKHLYTYFKGFVPGCITFL